MTKRTWTSGSAKSWICLSLGLGTLALYWPGVSHEFLDFDDQQYVTQNPQVSAGLTWRGVLWACETYSASNWHPLTWVSHMLDCQVYGLRPMGHHLTNILFHTANTLLLFLLLNRMTRARWRSACVAALFAWHPLHVESVAWVAERKDVLSAFFFLLTLGAYARYVDAAAARRDQQGTSPALYGYYALALFCFALALMSKPMAVTLPFVLMLLDYWPLRRFRRAGVWRLVLDNLPFLVLSVIGCGLTVAAQKKSFTIVSAASLPLSQKIQHALVAYAHYLGAAIAPWHLAAFYPYVRQPPAFEVAGAAALLALISALAARLAGNRPYLPVGWLWYLGTLVPVIGLVQVGDQAWADRYTYLPLIGVFIMVVWEVAEAAERFFGNTINTRRAVGAISALAAVVLLAATTLQLRYWKNTRSLFEHAAEVTRGNDRAATVLGSLAAADGRLAEARGLYALALSYNPDNPETHFHLGRLLDKEGKPGEALAEYDKALWARQWQEQAHIAMGVDLARLTNNEQAIFHYQAALALDPQSATAENNLARALHSQGRIEEAIRHYETAVRLSPQLAQAHNNLGVLLLQQGRLADGASQLHEAARLNPGNVETQYNLASALNQQEHWSEAAEIFGRLAPGRPNDAKLNCEYGQSLEHLGKTREAMSRYAHAVVLQPDFPEALDRLAWVLATSTNSEFRNGAEAFNMALKACELTGNKVPGPLMTLAAAGAEAGRFDEAIRAAEAAKSLETLKGRRESAQKCEQMLEAFRAGKPWREQAKAAADVSPSPK